MSESTYLPQIIDNLDEVRSLQKYEGTIFIDALGSQLRELFVIDTPMFVGFSDSDIESSEEFKTYSKDKLNSSTYVYFSWNNHLIRTLKEDDYFRLRTNRNQDLITREEQKSLYGKKIAILGMSVGSNIAFLLTQSGISRELTIADYDILETTNLNRIFAGLHQVGMSKIGVVAQKIYENNPFAHVNTLSKGVGKDNLEPLLQKGKLDLIIEEVDSLPIKIDVRLLAIEYKVPVMMVTDNGDSVILHVERYDLGHSKVFGKDPTYWHSKIKGGTFSREEMAKLIVEDIVGGRDKVDQRMLASVGRVIKKELISWPQLGSAAMLAGVVATIFAKRILLNENTDKDIRSHISIPEINLGSHK